MKTHARTVRRVDSAWLNAEIGKRIRETRESQGLTQAEVGIGLGVSRACIVNWELGKAQQNFLLTRLYDLALFFDVDVHRLLPK